MILLTSLFLSRCDTCLFFYEQYTLNNNSCSKELPFDNCFRSNETNSDILRELYENEQFINLISDEMGPNELCHYFSYCLLPFSLKSSIFRFIKWILFSFVYLWADLIIIVFRFFVSLFKGWLLMPKIVIVFVKVFQLSKYFVINYRTIITIAFDSIVSISKIAYHTVFHPIDSFYREFTTIKDNWVSLPFIAIPSFLTSRIVSKHHSAVTSIITFVSLFVTGFIFINNSYYINNALSVIASFSNAVGFIIVLRLLFRLIRKLC